MLKCFVIMAVGQGEKAGRKLENMCKEEFQITLKTEKNVAIRNFFFSSAESVRVRLVYSSRSLNTISY